MATNIRIEGFDEFKRDLGRAAEFLPDAVKQAMKKSTDHIKNRTQNKITDEGITFQGGLQQSIKARVPKWNRGEVIVGKLYGLFVEKGTKPHWPPREPIEKWARIKLGQPGLGFVIARSIARKGTKAHPWFEPGFKEALPKVIRNFEKVPEILVQIMAGKK